MSSEQASAAPLHLLFVGNPASIHVRRWAGFFAAHGHRVDVAGLWTALPDDADAPFPVHRLGRPATAAVALRRLARRVRPDVVHAHYLTHYGWLAWAAAIRPYVVTLWGSDVLLDTRRSPLRRAWARRTLAGAACVTADSPDVIAAAVRMGARADRIHEIQFGVDTTRFQPGPASPDLQRTLDVVGRRVVFAPRAIAPLYRTLVAVEALSALPDDVVLVATMAGAEPAYLARVRATIDRLGIASRVRLIPAIAHQEMDAHMRLADVVLSIPASDGTPVTMLEALSTGRPIVATDLPGVRPWLSQLRPDLMVPVDNAAATGAAIARALAMSEGERRTMAIAARQLAVMRGDQTRNMLRMEQLYAGLVKP